jgi:hypothetical protein
MNDYNREFVIRQLAEFIFNNLYKNESKKIYFEDLRKEQKDWITNTLNIEITSVEAEICDNFFIDSYFNQD